MAYYEYDAWGNHKVYSPTGTINISDSFIGNINPFRYRGYYYDRESNLYYCNARYYNSELCRWMSLDSIDYAKPDRLNGCNLYAYCNNNPAMFVDPSGHFWDYVLDFLSLYFGLGEFIADPTWDKAGWLALDLAFSFVPFIPSFSSARHIRRFDDICDFGNSFRVADNLRRTVAGFTISEHTIGTEIHGYFMKPFSINSKNIVDGIDLAGYIVYELKPYNKRSI